MIYQCECGQVHDNGVSRRHFLGLGAGAVFGYALTHFAHPIEAMAGEVGDPIPPKVLNLIIINMNGGPSHSDLFDAKSNADSSIRIRPDAEEDRMQIQPAPGANYPWPMGLLGELGQHANKMVTVPVQYWSEAHEIGQYLVYTGMDRNPAFQAVRPHIGSVVAAEMVRQSRRRETDLLPGFVSLNGLPYQNGFLSGMFAPFIVSANRAGLGGVLNHPEGEARFNERYRLITELDRANRVDNPPALGKPAADIRDFYGATKRMMYDRQVDETFKFTQEDQIRYSPIADPNGNGFGNACIVARNLLRAKRGTRVVNIITGGWDQHDNIYRNLFGADPARPNGNARQLSKGLSELIRDLKATPGERPSSTLFDETMIMCLGDFGRSPAVLYRTGNGINGTNGRDHYRVGTVLLASGALNGGRQIGATDETGRDIIDAGWDPFRSTTRRPRTPGGYPAAGNITRVEDVYYSVYKALGIDPATIYTGTPSGRPYQLVYGGGEIFNEIPLF